MLVSIPTIGGFKTSYPKPAFNKSTDSRVYNIFDYLKWVNVFAPFIKIPISFVGVSCFDATNKF